MTTAKTFSNTSTLENIYISPLELCNLRCLYCYTRKTKNILTNDQILDFVIKYQQAIKLVSPVKGRSGVAERGLKSIIFCGGEVFTLPDFPVLVNQLIQKGIFISIITNGTIDRLNEIDQPHNCQLIVSFDGPAKIHDANRGTGNFAKSKKFVQKALKLGFPVEIFYLITRDSYPYKDSFPKALKRQSPNALNFTYLTDRLGSLTSEQITHIRSNYPCYPPADFGCNMLSLQSNGKIYGCCESQKSIGSLADPVEKVIKNFIDITTLHPQCYDPKFHCGL